MNNEIETLVNQLHSPQDFAEEHCDWYRDDYVEEARLHARDWSIVDFALDTIREWAAESAENLATLREHVSCAK